LSRVHMIIVAALIYASPLHAIELQIYFTAMQRLLASQVFTQEGQRLYVRGDGKNKCNFAYLENPIVSSAGSKLAIRARFSGKTARNFFGKCVGVGDSFDLSIAAVPYYRDGMIALRDVKVESPGREGYYIRRVRAAIGDSLSRQFAYNVAADAKRILEMKRDSLYDQELRRFTVTAIRIAPDSLVVGLDFQLAVK
jgi:hypothetical protein